MSKAIVLTLEPEAKLHRERSDYWYVYTPNRELGKAASTPQEAWHQASAFLRGENYDRWFEAARNPQPKSASGATMTNCQAGNSG